MYKDCILKAFNSKDIKIGEYKGSFTDLLNAGLHWVKENKNERNLSFIIYDNKHNVIYYADPGVIYYLIT